MTGTDDLSSQENRREAGRWLTLVEEDMDVAIAAARLSLPRLGAAAFHLQQAAEKVVKALLVLSGKPFRRTHDLDYLVTKLAPISPAFQETLEQLRPLTVWGVAFRYPAVDDEPTPPPAPQSTQAPWG
jgi:HEPN domain-containing protein